MRDGEMRASNWPAWRYAGGGERFAADMAPDLNSQARFGVVRQNLGVPGGGSPPGHGREYVAATRRRDHIMTLSVNKILALGGLCLTTLLAASLQSPVRAEAQPAVQPTKAATGSKTASTSASDICGVLAQAAADNELPFDFFTRLIW